MRVSSVQVRLRVPLMLVILISASVLAGFALSGEPITQNSSSPSEGMVGANQVEWWFDPVSKAVCWDGRTSAFEKFRVDFDGNRGTSVTSQWVGVPTPNVVTPSSRMYDGSSAIPGLSGLISWLAEDLVNPPVPHFRHYNPINDTYSERYHVFVTKLDPPTDYVVGVQRSDGQNIIPLTDPFWYTENGGGSWHLFNPSVDSKGDRTCREDFPDVNIETHLDIDPDTLNLKSKGRWITAYLITENASVHDIDISTILLQDALEAERYDYQDDILMLKFNRQEFKDTVQVGDSVQIKIAGKWKDGTAFEAYDSIRVINP